MWCEVGSVGASRKSPTHACSDSHILILTLMIFFEIQSCSFFGGLQRFDLIFFAENLGILYISFRILIQVGFEMERVFNWRISNLNGETIDNGNVNWWLDFHRLIVGWSRPRIHFVRLDKPIRVQNAIFWTIHTSCFSSNRRGLNLTTAWKSQVTCAKNKTRVHNYPNIMCLLQRTVHRLHATPMVALIDSSTSMRNTTDASVALSRSDADVPLLVDGITSAMWFIHGPNQQGH